MQHIHFIGIGGIGMSALAKFYRSMGETVSGSDLVPSAITRELSLMGIPVTIGSHRAENLPHSATLVVHSAAIPKANPEFAAAVARGIPAKSYAAALSPLTKRYKTITISGAHGKSTTTALVSLVLEDGYCDPTVIIGTKLTEFGNSNFRRGLGPYLVLEADEYRRSFLKYSPSIAVVTNIDAEHLDTYRDIASIEQAFKQFLLRVPSNGTIIANRDDPRLKRLGRSFGKRVTWYSLDDADAPRLKKVLRIPGTHNLSNALAALAVGRTIGIPESTILYAIGRFRGAWRRFEFRGIANGAYVISDYAHHPREISATISAARERFPLRRIWCVFQPHHYERLVALWDDFAGAFDLADRTLLLPVYDVAGRERKRRIAGIGSDELAIRVRQRGKNAAYCASPADAIAQLKETAHTGDVILFMGAGDIDEWTHAFVTIPADERLIAEVEAS